MATFEAQVEALTSLEMEKYLKLPTLKKAMYLKIPQ